ncbi:hypothetical protein NL676_028737 [Syzygium grande]|nr:hypothetical protein NL676_028737 [Syzygium grande]
MRSLMVSAALIRGHDARGDLRLRLQERRIRCTRYVECWDGCQQGLGFVGCSGWLSKGARVCVLFLGCIGGARGYFEK